MAEYAHLSQPDPELVPFLDMSTAEPPLRELYPDPKERRAVYTSWIGSTLLLRMPQGNPRTEYRTTDYHVPVDNGSILVRSYVPVTEGELTCTYPLFVWMHGGGWTNGDITSDDYALRAVCVESQVSIVNLEYRLVPEHAYPTGLNDCYAAIKWAVESAASLCADPKRGFVIGGISAGAHMSAVITHRARGDIFFRDTPLTGQILQVPAVVHPNAVPERYKSQLLSMEQNKASPMLDRPAAEFYYGQMALNPEDPELSPLLYDSHAGLPPAVIMVCGMDPLRDEGILYDKLLREEGVKTRLTLYPGVPHGFHTCFPTFKSARNFEQDFMQGLRWILDGAPQE